MVLKERRREEGRGGGEMGLKEGRKGRVRRVLRSEEEA